MLRLALKTLPYRKGGSLALLVALFIGGVVVQGSGGLLETGIRGQVKAERLAAAPLVVTGSQAYPGVNPVGYDTEAMTERVLLDEDLVDTVASVPGVEAAVPDVAVPVTALDGVPVTAGGHSWSSASLAPYELVAGEEPAAAGEVVVDSATASRLDLEPGAPLTVAVRGTEQEYQVSGIAESQTATRPALLFTDDEATLLYDRPGRVDAIGVLAAPDADPAELAAAVREAVADRGARVLRGDDRGVAEYPEAIEGSEYLIPLAGAFGGLATMVAVFVVGSTVALLVQQRRREMALLRTIGVTPAQVRHLVLAETSLIAVLAAGLSIVPGQAFGRFLFDVLARQGMVPDVMVFRQGWLPQFVGVGTTLLAAMAAALIASRRVSRVRPTEAMAEATLQTRWVSPIRLLLAFITLGGATALAIVTATVMSGPVAASTAAPAAMAWAVGIALVAPGLCRWFAALLRWPVTWVTGLSGRLAMLNASVRKVRLAAAVIPIMLVTGLATALIFLETTQQAVNSRLFAEGTNADAVVASSNESLPHSLVEELAGLPEVAGASASVFSNGRLEAVLGPGEDNEGRTVDERVRPSRIQLLGVTAPGAQHTVARPAVQGDYGDLTGDSIVLPTDVLEREEKEIGDSMQLRWGDGQVSEMTVVGSFTAPRGYGYAMVPADALLPHTTDGALPQILLKAEQGVSPSALAEALREAVDGVPGAVVAERAEVYAASGEGTGQIASFLIAAVVVGYAGIALVNSLIVATTERRGEFALQRLVGSTRGQVMRMLSVEALVTALVGTLLGTAVAAGSLIPFGLALDGTVMPSGPGWIYPAIVGSALALTFVTILVPTWLALRKLPVEAAAGP